MGDDILVATTDTVPGYRVVKVLGVVSGSSVRARHLGRDIVATVRTILGGEVKEYTELLAHAREEALSRMKEKARKMGANAVIGFRFATSMIGGRTSEILAYGTAVVLEEASER
ncbi:MAG: YbjQ family protein [Desulfurococcales archaeon]|nr:YbjQ family protein [Desulfurococcales archaeon]